MFENKQQISGRESSPAEGGLRPFGWEELSARLAARRDLRGLLGPRSSSLAASFDAVAAAHLATPSVGPEYVKPEINPDGLGDGKYPWATKPSS